MPVTAIVGAQWGDEGKGKITDLLAQEADLVIRYQGGNNAGHTVVNDRGTFKLHLVPSGIFNPSAVCVLGTGMVIDLGFLAEEIASLEKRGVSTANLRISERAHLIMPWHIALDRLDERERGRRKLGTTGQGVGPAYADKVGRHGIQLYEVRDEAAFRARVAHELDTKNAILTKFGDAPLDPRAVADAVLAAAAVLGDRIVDTLPIVERAVASDARVLLEGQLGAMRDLDWGIYPYVTSSNPLAGFASIGGRGAVPDGARRRGRELPARARRGVRRDHRAAAADRLVRRGGGPPRATPQRIHRARGHEARHARHVRRDPLLHGV